MKLFVGTCRKIGRGCMYGKWLDLDKFSCAEEFLLACKKVHWEEKNPVFFFRGCRVSFDWELSLYSEFDAPYGYWEIKRELKMQLFDEDAFSAFAHSRSEYPSVHLVRKCAASYLGAFGSVRNYLEWFYKSELCVSEMDESEFERCLSEYESCGILECVNGYVFQS